MDLFRYPIDMKKALLKLMCLVIGLNVFTACYGPAPYPDGAESEDTELNDGTKTDTDEDAEESESEENAEKA